MLLWFTQYILHCLHFMYNTVSKRAVCRPYWCERGGGVNIVFVYFGKPFMNVCVHKVCPFIIEFIIPQNFWPFIIEFIMPQNFCPFIIKFIMPQNFCLDEQNLERTCQRNKCYSQFKMLYWPFFNMIIKFLYCIQMWTFDKVFLRHVIDVIINSSNAHLIIAFDN